MNYNNIIIDFFTGMRGIHDLFESIYEGLYGGIVECMFLIAYFIACFICALFVLTLVVASYIHAREADDCWRGNSKSQRQERDDDDYDNWTFI